MGSEIPEITDEVKEAPKITKDDGPDSSDDEKDPVTKTRKIQTLSNEHHSPKPKKDMPPAPRPEEDAGYDSDTSSTTTSSSDEEMDMETKIMILMTSLEDRNQSLDEEEARKLLERYDCDSRV